MVGNLLAKVLQRRLQEVAEEVAVWFLDREGLLGHDLHSTAAPGEVIRTPSQDLSAVCGLVEGR